MATVLQQKRIFHKNFYISKIPQYSQTVLDAMEEAKNISRNPNIKGYSTMEELEAALLKNS